MAALLPCVGRLRKLLIATLVCPMLFAVALYAGPVTSGAIFLLLPTHQQPAEHDLPDSYQPLHKGHVDLSTGRYVRENEDLVVRGTPALILRRTYLSGYQAQKEFGIGTTHNGEQYVMGDGEKFQWTSLIEATGSRVNFNRSSSGLSFLNAMYEARTTPGEWQNARMGWTGSDWAVRRTDGVLSRYRPCGPGHRGPCAITQWRDADGHAIQYQRDRAGRLLKMVAGSRWIAFDYDAANRIARAYTSTAREVRYEYDARGRLSRVSASDGTVHQYTHTERDELATIDEPGTSIENIYDANGRVVRQVNRYPNEDPYIFDFKYRLEDGNVVQTDTMRSDGTWSTHTFDASRYTTSEVQGSKGFEPAVFTFERDPRTNAITALSLTCPDRTGRPLRHSSIVRDGNEEWIKWDLLQTHCSWRKPRISAGGGHGDGGGGGHGTRSTRRHEGTEDHRVQVI